MGLDPTALGIGLTLAVTATYGVAREMRRCRASRAALVRAQELGLDEPLSLHPVIDPLRCVGCAGCIEACPEEDVLQLVDGRARLVNAAHCIGHGLCQSACPNDAIDLVFGTEKRSVQLPEVKGDYQSNVPGVYIAGELGGMGLIRNAMNQGMQAVAAMHQQLASEKQAGADPTPVDVDVAVIGAGPAGIAAALACQERDLSHVVLDQDGLGGCVNHYPRRLTFGLRMSRIPGMGPLPRAEKRRLRSLVRSRLLVERRRAFLHQTETLFGHWHAIHKPFALLLFTMMALHIGIAVWLGYAWAW